VNEGCIPTKALLRSAEVVHLVREKAAKYGVRGVDPDEILFDLAAAMKRKDKVVQGIIDGIYRNLKKNKGITLINGIAEYSSPVDIRVDGKKIVAEKSILAVGSKQAVPEIPGLEEAGYITNNEALALKELPESMIIIGGGYVGVEFAQMYSRFGTEVTIICRSSRIMSKEEPELSELLGELLVEEGIDSHLSTEVVRAGIENGKRFVIAENDQGEQRYEAEVLLLAAGRIARVDNLGLDQTEIAMRGPFIKVDEHLKTTAPNIWSLGDANGKYMFTHRARYDGPISALNAVNDANKVVDYRVVPRAVFTEPTLASVGMNEETAKKTGRMIKTGKAYFKHSGRANAMGQPEGLAKIVIDADSKEILGAHILSVHADILIHEVVVAMHGNGSLDRLTKSIHIHPTLSEVVYEAARAAR